MTLTLAISSAWHRLMGRRSTAQEGTMPTAAAARPDWRLAQGRDWAPVYEEPQAISREYGDSRNVRLVHHMPGGQMVSVYSRRDDGSRGRFVESYWLSEPEADWPATKAMLEAGE